MTAPLTYEGPNRVVRSRSRSSKAAGGSARCPARTRMTGFFGRRSSSRRRRTAADSRRPVARSENRVRLQGVDCASWSPWPAVIRSAFVAGWRRPRLSCRSGANTAAHRRPPTSAIPCDRSLAPQFPWCPNERKGAETMSSKFDRGRPDLLRVVRHLPSDHSRSPRHLARRAGVSQPLTEAAAENCTR